MHKYRVVAFADIEYGLPKREAFIKAESYEEAKKKAWKMFPEYHEIMVNIINDNYKGEL